MSKSRIFIIVLSVVIFPLACWLTSCSTPPPHNLTDRLLGGCVLSVIAFFYWTPMFIAGWGNATNFVLIALLNTFTGITGIGWVVSLMWALFAIIDRRISALEEKLDRRSISS